jgi:hypothetical protein
MSKKPQTGRVFKMPAGSAYLAGESCSDFAMTPKQIAALTAPGVKVEMFVSSRLGPESVSHETEQEHDAERKIIQRVAAALGDA